MTEEMSRSKWELYRIATGEVVGTYIRLEAAEDARHNAQDEPRFYAIRSLPPEPKGEDTTHLCGGPYFVDGEQRLCTKPGDHEEMTCGEPAHEAAVPLEYRLDVCPFCGEVPEEVHTNDLRDFYVGCANEQCPVQPETGLQRSAEAARKEWNWRPAPATEGEFEEWWDKAVQAEAFKSLKHVAQAAWNAARER